MGSTLIVDQEDLAMNLSNTALLVIDLQMDYFTDGLFPLWQAEPTKKAIVEVMQKVSGRGGHVIHVQHIAQPANGMAPFFNKGTSGVVIHPDILAAAPDAPVIVKHFADAFHQTDLGETLAQRKISQLLVCGMMTQNCVTHTAISRSAEPYEVKVVADCCTTQTEMLHRIALNALSTRIPLLSAAEI